MIKKELDFCQSVSKVYCNMCGKEIEKNAHGYFNDYLHIEKTWGYTSKSDGERHEFDLCEDCVKKLIMSFKIRP